MDRNQEECYARHCAGRRAVTGANGRLSSPNGLRSEATNRRAARHVQARIETDGSFCNTAAAAAACNTTLVGRPQGQPFCRWAKCLLQRLACTQTGAVGQPTRSATRHNSGVLPTKLKSLQHCGDGVRACIAASQHSVSPPAINGRSDGEHKRWRIARGSQA